ncbi:uncharacterized protein LY89DRAFT_26441 [Mollisia scopiformis]|uniref:Uncharacterized protein n=1 Tax=Mollisia scopiformis TaxID=149040 RepID=A0A194XXU7_MOLSC|nr:uncharacterized protein LY89DRAFT_26441 [Mollisia scopiformis]KUJ24657.1 hypothetical protein LY89DRAFT_26441 [Mollisia scopiformis]
MYSLGCLTITELCQFESMIDRRNFQRAITGTEIPWEPYIEEFLRDSGWTWAPSPSLLHEFLMRIDLEGPVFYSSWYEGCHADWRPPPGSEAPAPRRQ